MKKINYYQLTIALLLFSIQSSAQTIIPDLQDKDKWELLNRTAEPINEPGKKGIRLSEAQGEGAMVLKEYEFSDGTIEMDIKGKNIPQQSFVGLAFHGQDEETYDAIYFRPFNFVSPDTIKRKRAVQYVSMPDFRWEKLRKDSTGKYESNIYPVPDPKGWFHVRVAVHGKQIKVFVDNAEEPCLEVKKLTKVKKGGFALWVGNNSGAEFANLKIIKQSVNNRD